jgi:hypothetical protein
MPDEKSVYSEHDLCFDGIFASLVLYDGMPG